MFHACSLCGAQSIARHQTSSALGSERVPACRRASGAPRDGAKKMRKKKSSATSTTTSTVRRFQTPPSARVDRDAAEEHVIHYYITYSEPHETIRSIGSTSWAASVTS